MAAAVLQQLFYFLAFSVNHSRSPLPMQACGRTCKSKTGICLALYEQDDYHTLNAPEMNKALVFIFLLLVASYAMGQMIGRVDKRTKEFYIVSDLKIEYRVFGYQFASEATPKMICFSSHAGDVAANYNNCPLGAYYDTGKMKVGDKIIYLGPYGRFGKMSYVSGSGKKTIFYLPKSSFIIK